MPRRIEVLLNGVWTTAEGELSPDTEWRYVGGVLEYRDGTYWIRECDHQGATLMEAHAMFPGSVFRLRPYEKVEDKVEPLIEFEKVNPDAFSYFDTMLTDRMYVHDPTYKTALTLFATERYDLIEKRREGRGLWSKTIETAWLVELTDLERDVYRKRATLFLKIQNDLSSRR